MDTVALRPSQRPLVHLGLLVLTLATIFEAYLSLQSSGDWNRANVTSALAFSLSVLAILGSHEMGHYFLARRHGVDTSLPYFIPLPHLGFGTLGAVIRLRGPIPSRNALVDIGAAGPLAGFLVAIPVLLWGYGHAQVVDVPLVASTFPPAESAFRLGQYLLHCALHHVAPDGAVYGYGDNLLTLLIQRAMVGPLPAGKDVVANPCIIAGWFGCIVTTLNLFPIGQLDAGHLAFANLGGRAIALGKLAAAALWAMVLFFNVFWLPWTLVVTLAVGFRHPEVERPEEGLDVRRLLLCIACAVVFLLCFTPALTHFTLGPP